jgi:hypothetical protein
MFLLLARRVGAGWSGRAARSWSLLVTFGLGMVGAALAAAAIERASALTALDVRVAEAGERGALVFVFFVVGPLQEVAKVAAVWPAFLWKRGSSFDGILYATAAALGFATVGTALVLRAHPDVVWLARVAVALPAQVFFAALWGHALARARRSRMGVPVFPAAFVSAVALHGLYLHFAFGRGPGALLANAPLLAVMGLVAWVVLRDPDREGPPSSVVAPSSSRRPGRTQPPSLAAVRRALQRADEPVKIGWVVFGALVTIGAMVAGLAASVIAAHVLHVDLSTIDEKNVLSASPVLLLGVGLLISFPVSGWLVARAARVRTLLEPALATVLALLVTVVTLGLAAPVTVVFALALSPIAWVLACVGAWMGAEV